MDIQSKQEKQPQKRLGVYKITNLLNNKIYVGSSANLEVRWEHHKIRLRCGDHHNKHLQSAWNLQWSHNFKFEIIEECNIDKLAEKEQYWINFLDATNKNKGYNKRKIAHSNQGIKCSEETKLKMSLAQKGKPREYARQNTKENRPDRAAKISAKLKEHHVNNPQSRYQNKELKLKALKKGLETRWKIPDNITVIDY